MVVRSEVLVGVRVATDGRRCHLLLARFRSCDVTLEIADAAAGFRRAYHLKIPGAPTLATAAVNGRVLVTRDTTDFPADRSDVIVPYRLL